MNLNNFKKIYMIGIKGVGMTAVAQVLKSRGKEICGSDTHEKFFTDEILKKEKIKFYEGFDAAHLEMEKPDLVIYSTAYTDENAELAAARKSGVAVLSYPEALGAILKEGFGIAVCGTHGKTTTAAMLGFVLAELGADPTVLVGSAVPQFGGNARVGKSPSNSPLGKGGGLIVVEADEYQNKFLQLDPRGIVLTSIEYDHPDFFKTPEEYVAAFKNFVEKIPASGFLVACFDDKNVREVAKSASCKVISYGLQNGDWQAKNLAQLDRSKYLGGVGWGNCPNLPGGMSFEVFENGKSRGVFQIQLFGNHNVTNTLAVIAVASHLGYDIDKIREVLKKFKGTARRFEIKGEVRGITIIDDYGHHPTEIQVTLKAARERYPNRRIWCIFHPHTFTRTKTLLQDFAKSFHNADKTIVIDIYGSAREKVGGIHSRDLVELIKKEGDDALYIPTIPEAAEFLAREVKSGDIVITMGAGDVWRVGETLNEKLKIKN
jgi:UDP-N-acetylmuramate--alanine ligase